MLFSSSPFDHRETSHVNVQPPEHWAELFARHGFYRDVDYDASFVTPWAVRFRRSHEPIARIVRNFERRFWVLNYERNETRTRTMQVERQLAEALGRTSAAEEKAAGAEEKAGRLEAKTGQVEAQLAHARTTIEMIERSLFWKARRVWVAINGLFGRAR